MFLVKLKLFLRCERVRTPQKKPGFQFIYQRTLGKS